MKAANDQFREIKKLRREESKSFKSMRSSTSLISVSYRITWMRVNPSLSPTQLTILNPRCQKYSRGSSSVGSFLPSGVVGCPILVHPTFRQGAVIVSHAARFAIGGPNALKSFVLFLKVFQVIDDKTVTNKVSLNFHFLLPLVTSLKIYQRISFKNLRALSLSLRSSCE